jgi:exopolysaccharide biosynthesis polyprenyl glycosylphosphotransferase
MAQVREKFRPIAIGSLAGKYKPSISLQATERKLLLYVIDFSAIVLSLGSVIAFWEQFIHPEHQIIDQLPWTIWLAVVWLLWLFVNHLYELPIAARFVTSAKRIVTGIIPTSIAYIVYYFGTNDRLLINLSRLLPLCSLVITTLFLIAGRSLYCRVFETDLFKQRLAIIGTGKAALAIAEVAKKHPHYQPIGFLDKPSECERTSELLPFLGNLDTLEVLIERRAIDEIAIASETTIDREMLDRFIIARAKGIVVTPMPILYERLTGKVAIDCIGNQWYASLPFRMQPLELLYKILKRGIDLLCSLPICLILAIIFPFVALAIKLNSPGPIFYTQERAGLYGKSIVVYKFRSMIRDAEKNGRAKWAQKGDSRITKVGWFMRKTRIDELPQIINVLKGEMSFVGPRPERPEFIKDLEKQIPFYRIRLSGKPGLTGWAQVNYGYGASVEDAYIKLQYDLYYLKHWSPWLDIQILLRTFAIVFKMQGQ